MFKDEGQDKPEITKFCIDKRHRKAYIANNLGQIIVINCENGVILKHVNEADDDISDEEAESDLN